MVNKTITSNASVVEAHGLEYRSLDRLTQTFTVCIEDTHRQGKVVYTRQ